MLDDKSHISHETAMRSQQSSSHKSLMSTNNKQKYKLKISEEAPLSNLQSRKNIQHIIRKKVFATPD